MSDYGAELLKRQLTGKIIILLGHIGEPHKKMISIISYLYNTNTSHVQYKCHG